MHIEPVKDKIRKKKMDGNTRTEEKQEKDR